MPSEETVLWENVCGLWPSGETGVGSIPTRHSGYMQQPAVSLSNDSEMSVGIKLNREVHMKAGNKTKTEKTTLKLKARLTLNFRIIVAVVVGCLMVAPLTRAHNHAWQMRTMPCTRRGVPLCSTPAGERPR